MKHFNPPLVAAFLLVAASLTARAADEGPLPKDSTAVCPHHHRQAESRLHIGGYGEAAYTRNFFSDNVYRYKGADSEAYKNAPSHGRFDIPHATIWLGYDFGKGWSFGSEIEFEHGGTGTAYETEYDEGGELEQEAERGGEVALEQFWIQKSFSPALNLRLGHIVVPVGLLNAYHEPLNYFTVYRPEGEYNVLPSTWHQTGVSLWGRAGDWRYEAQFLAGLDAMYFNTEHWIKRGAGSAFEYDMANKYGTALRVDNFSIPGLRLGLSGYYGHSINNTNTTATGDKVRKLRGAVLIGSADFTYEDHGLVARGQVDYGTLSDAHRVSTLPDRGTAPYSSGDVGKAAVAVGIEAGWDLFSVLPTMRDGRQNFFLFGRYEYYNSYLPASGTENYHEYTAKHRIAVGINYRPVPQVVLKAEYSHRFLKAAYADEPSISLGIAYEARFL